MYLSPHSLSLTVGWVLALTLGVMALLLWTARIEKRLLAFFSLMCLAWGTRAWMSAHNMTALELGWHLPAHAVEVLPSALVLVFLGAQTLLILQVIGDLTRSHMQRLMLRGFAGILAAAALFYAGYGLLGLRIWVSLACFVVMGLATFRLFKRGYTKRSAVGRWQTLAMIGGHAIFALCAGVDLLAVWGVIVTKTLWVHWGFSVLLFSYGCAAASYVLKAWRIEEGLKDLLQQKVDETTLELSAAHAKVLMQEQQLARADERAQMVRELHDGLGGNLITAIRTLDGSTHPILQGLLQDSLDDLRMLMDAHHVQGHWVVALAAWRNRWDARLAALGIALQWRIEDSVDEVVLSSNQTLQLLRILQEAVNNVIKHAKASELTVQSLMMNHELVLRVFDNGIGLQASSNMTSGGIGLASLSARGLQIGGTVTVGVRTDGLSGTQVQVVLPLASPPSAS